jgi:hypothetical protein
VTSADELTRDPLFQQNVVFWLAQEGTGDGITPLLRSQGFSVFAVGRRLSLSAPARSALAATAVAANQTVAPDVLLLRGVDGRLLVVECKSSSFGPGSTTAKQARAMILVCGNDTADAVGLSSAEFGAALLGYLVPDGQTDPLAATLNALTDEMRNSSLVPGESTVLALAHEGPDDSIALIVSAQGAAFLDTVEGRHNVLRFSAGTDPRPLYFFPYDPDVDQTAEERERCASDLRKRLHQQLVSRIAGAGHPSSFRLDLDAMLDSAYFGLYRLWDNPDAKRHLRSFSRSFVHGAARAVQRSAPGTLVHDGSGWVVSIGDEAAFAAAVGALQRFDPETEREEDLTLTETEGS